MSQAYELEVYADGAAVARALAELIVDVGQTAQADRGRFTMALAGGNTPREAYRLLGEEPFRSALSWSDVFVYFGDERCVPPGDEQANYRMARETFLDRVDIPSANVHRIQGEIDPAEAARTYAAELRGDLGDPPVLDLVMLGMGGDAHTASLFPGADPTTDDDALVRGVYAESQLMWRVTLTPRAINAARTVAFVVEGASKATTLAAVLEGPYDPVHLPAQIIRPANGRLVWITDELAAGLLKKR